MCLEGGGQVRFDGHAVILHLPGAGRIILDAVRGHDRLDVDRGMTKLCKSRRLLRFRIFIFIFSNRPAGDLLLIDRRATYYCFGGTTKLYASRASIGVNDAILRVSLFQTL